MSATSVRTACPHDCPSGCGLAVERLADGRIGRVRGDPQHPYTAVRLRPVAGAAG